MMKMMKVRAGDEVVQAGISGRGQHGADCEDQGGNNSSFFNSRFIIFNTKSKIEEAIHETKMMNFVLQMMNFIINEHAFCI